MEQQGWVSHFIELRQRLIKMIAVPVVIVLCALPFSNELYALLASPMLAYLPKNSAMIATQVTAPLLVPFKFTGMLAIVFSMPWILFQFWRFLSPGLYVHERRILGPLLFATVLFFYLGIAFAYFVVFPLLFQFFASVLPKGIIFMPDIGDYLDFTLKMFLACGLVFEIPIVINLLILTGIVPIETLRKNRAYIILIILIVAAVLTPPDVVSQLLLAVPMWLLFEVSLFFGQWLKVGRPPLHEAQT